MGCSRLTEAKKGGCLNFSAHLLWPGSVPDSGEQQSKRREKPEDATQRKQNSCGPVLEQHQRGPQQPNALQSDSSPFLVLLNSVNRVFVDIQSYSQYNLFPFYTLPYALSLPCLAFFLQLPPESGPSLLYFSFLSLEKMSF